jgi:hypothetical protein
MWPNDHIASRMCEIAVGFERIGAADAPGAAAAATNDASMVEEKKANGTPKTKLPPVNDQTRQPGCRMIRICYSNGRLPWRCQ